MSPAGAVLDRVGATAAQVADLDRRAARAQVVAWTLAVFATAGLATITYSVPGVDASVVESVPRVSPGAASALIAAILALLIAIGVGTIRSAWGTAGVRSEISRAEHADSHFRTAGVVAGLLAALVSLWGAIGAVAAGGPPGGVVGEAVAVLALGALTVAVSSLIDITPSPSMGVARERQRREHWRQLDRRLTTWRVERPLPRGLALLRLGLRAPLQVLPLVGVVLLLGVVLLRPVVAAVVLVVAPALLVVTAVSAALVASSWVGVPRRLWVAAYTTLAVASLAIALAIGLARLGAPVALLGVAPSLLLIVRIVGPSLAAVLGVSRVPVSARPGSRLAALRDESFVVVACLLASELPPRRQPPVHPGAVAVAGSGRS